MKCNLCGGHALFLANSIVYGRKVGRWPYVWYCSRCSAYVGVHTGTTRPLGTLADATTRKARKEAHLAFDPLWRSGPLSRHEAYGWLAGQLGIAHDQCHIGMFDATTCQRVVAIMQDRRELAHGK